MCHQHGVNMNHSHPCCEFEGQKYIGKKRIVDNKKYREIVVEKVFSIKSNIQNLKERK